MRSLERVNIRTNESTYVLTYIRTGQTLYPLHNFVVRGDNRQGSRIRGNKSCSMADGISFDVSLSLNCTDLYKRGGGA